MRILSLIFAFAILLSTASRLEAQCTPPTSPPTNISSSNVDGDQYGCYKVHLQWFYQGGGSPDFDIRNADTGALLVHLPYPNNVFCNLEGLQPNTTYRITVTAVNSCGSQPSAVFTFSTANVGCPNMPISTSASTNIVQTVSVDFSYTAGNSPAAGFRLYKRYVNEPNTKMYTQATCANCRTLGVSSDLYVYEFAVVSYVQAQNGIFESDIANWVVGYPSGTPLTPDPPLAYFPASGNNNGNASNVRFKWYPTNNARKFNLQVSTVNTFDDPSLITITGINTQEGNGFYYQDVLNSLQLYQQYYWRLQSTSGQDVTGLWSQSIPFKIVAPPPTPSVMATPDANNCTGNGGVTVSWSNVAGETEYRVYIDAIGQPVATVPPDTTTYVDVLSAPGIHEYYVTAYRPDGGESNRGHAQGCMPGGPGWIQSQDRVVDVRDAGGAYDQQRNRFVIFGGYDAFSYAGTGGYTNDTWTFDLPPRQPHWIDWNQAVGCFPPGTVPSPRAHAGVIYDPPGDRLLAYGGDASGEVWEMDMTPPFPQDPIWCQVPTSGSSPSIIVERKVAFDSRRRRLLVVSPTQGVFALDLATRTWSQPWAGNMTTSMIGEKGSTAAYDAYGDRLVVFGGWRYTGTGDPNSEYMYGTAYGLSLASPTGWTALGTGGPGKWADGSMVYDSEGIRMIYYGGEKGVRTGGHATVNSSAWALSMMGSPVWTQLNVPGKNPPGRYAHTAIFGNDMMIIFGGAKSASQNSSDIWYFHVPDTTPPAAVTNMYIDYMGTTTAGIVWTAPGDDGNVGQASVYDVRFSETPIVNDADFSRGSVFDQIPAPGPAGTNQGAVTTRLRKCTQYWFALKTGDEAGNWSSLSNVRTARTTGTGPGCILSADLPTKDMKLSLKVDQISRSQAVLNVSLDGEPGQPGYDLTVYDVAGRVRRQFNPADIVADGGQMVWDLTDNQGIHLPSGIYFLRLTGRKSTITQRILALH